MATTRLSPTAYQASVTRLKLAIEGMNTPVTIKTVSDDDIWEAFITTLPANERQYHNCNTCRKAMTAMLKNVDASLHSSMLGTFAVGSYSAALAKAASVVVNHVQARLLSASRDSFWKFIAHDVEPFHALTKRRKLGVASSGGYQHFHAELRTVYSAPFDDWASVVSRIASFSISSVAAQELMQYAGRCPAPIRQSMRDTATVLASIIEAMAARKWYTVVHLIAANWKLLHRKTMAQEVMEVALTKGWADAIAFANKQASPLKYQRKTAELTIGQVKVMSASAEMQEFTDLTERCAVHLSKMPNAIWTIENAAAIPSSVVTIAGARLTVKSGSKQRGRVEQMNMAAQEFTDFLKLLAADKKLASLKLRVLTDERAMLTFPKNNLDNPLFRWGNSNGFYVANSGRPMTLPETVTNVVQSPAVFSKDDIYAPLVFATWSSSEYLRHSGVFAEVLSPRYKQFAALVEGLSKQPSKLRQPVGVHNCYGIVLNGEGAKYVGIVQTSDGTTYNVTVG